MIKILINLLLILYSHLACALIKPIVSISFDEGSYNQKIKSVYSGNKAELKIVNGVKGKGLHLANSCISIGLDEFSISGEGSISIWVKPDWGYYERFKDKLLSHTFLSMKWSDGGYFVLSDGWWEENGGSQRTYFVFNNKKHSHLHKEIKYKKNQWMNLTITWSDIYKSINLYKNGNLISSRYKSSKSNVFSNELVVGCDKGTNLFSSRWANAVIDELKIYDEALSDKDIYQALGINKKDLKRIEYGYLDKNTDSNNTNSNLGLPENRVMFDSYPASWQTKEQALSTIKRLYDAGINVYVPCVWYGDGARFDSKVAPAAIYKGKNSPLKNLIKIAHEYGIEVHPWITVAYRSRDFLSEFYDEGTPPKAFDVQNKNFRDFMVKFILDMTSRYDVDGINLDYIRTMGISKSKSSQKKFKSKYKKDLLSEIKKKDANLAWNENVQGFVDAPINDIVKRVSDKVRLLKPDVIISVDGHPKPSFLGKSRQGRNEVEWLNKGLIDIVYIMNYGSDIDYEGVDLIKSEVKDPNQVIVLLGVFDEYNNTVVSRSSGLLEKLVRFSRQRWNSGVAFYPYSKVNEDIYSLFKDKLFIRHVKTNWHSD